MISKKTKRVIKLKVLSISLAMLVISVLVLLELPKGVSLAQTEIFVTPSSPEVAGIEKKPSLEIKSSGVQPPNFTAKSVIAKDIETDEILYQKDIHKRLLPASTTKLMTALVAMDQFKLSDILTVSQDDLVGGSVMGLNSGEKVSFRSLLYGMLLNSGNDAAFTIADNFPGKIDAFVTAMNNKATSLGLTDTHFQNPAGFDSPEQYSSAYDLSIIAEAVASNSELINITSTKDTTVYSTQGAKQHLLHNLNKLLNEVGVIGIKTGFTEEAGENFVGLVDRGGHKVLTVVLDSTDRFGETKSLMDWVFKNFSWQVSS